MGTRGLSRAKKLSCHGLIGKYRHIEWNFFFFFFFDKNIWRLFESVTFVTSFRGATFLGLCVLCSVLVKWMISSELEVKHEVCEFYKSDSDLYIRDSWDILCILLYFISFSIDNIFLLEKLRKEET